MEMLDAVTSACAGAGSPVVLRISYGALRYMSKSIAMRMVRGAVERVREDLGSAIPIALEAFLLDTLDQCRQIVDLGFSAINYDGSYLSFEENIAMTAAVVECAHARGIWVEGNPGHMLGIEDDVRLDPRTIDPDRVKYFIESTGVDGIGLSYSSAMSPYKGYRDPIPLEELRVLNQRFPNFPLALPADLPTGDGCTQETARTTTFLQRAISLGVSKINIGRGIWTHMSAAIKSVLQNSPEEFDPRKYLGPGRDAVAEGLKAFLIDVIGSAHRG
jgi:fructose-bisphosphate aldolase class II